MTYNYYKGKLSKSKYSREEGVMSVCDDIYSKRKKLREKTGKIDTYQYDILPEELMNANSI